MYGLRCQYYSYVYLYACVCVRVCVRVRLRNSAFSYFLLAECRRARDEPDRTTEAFLHKT